MSRAAGVAVWDLPVRVLHWTLAAAVAGAWLTRERYGRLHEVCGYVAAAAVALRLAWGFVGGPRARFADFVRGPRVASRYLLDVVRGRERRHLGHNPLGGWMIVALLGATAAVAFSGWLFTTDRFWGDPQVESWHDALAWTMLGLVVLHVAGVVFTSLRQRENLPLAMWRGTKRPPSGDDAG